MAGGLATLNPCGFPVLSAFLAYNLRAEGAQPRAPDVGRALLTGLLVTAGFLGVFTVFGLPLGYGVAAISTAVPWVGLAVGGVLLVIGLATLVGRGIAVPGAARWPLRPPHDATTQVLFGAGYGVASFGCTLPVFLTLVGAAAGAGGLAPTLVVFAAYGTGMSLVLIVLSVGGALVGGGLARRARRTLPYVESLTGGLLAVSGGYLLYYWVRVGFGSPAELAADPLVGLVTDLAARVEALAQDAGAFFMVPVAGLVAVIMLVSLRPRREAKAVSMGQPSTNAGRNRPSGRVLSRTGLLVMASVTMAAVIGGLMGYGIGRSNPHPNTAANTQPADASDLSIRAPTDQERELLQNEGPAARIAEFASIENLRDSFNERAGVARLILLLSPTCVTCLRGASWIQQELAKYPTANIHVYAIWFPMLPGDGRAKWDGRILNDPRVTHLWDEQQVTGRWLAQRGYGDLPVQWDTAFLYSPYSRWDGDDKPSHLVIWRRPIIAYTTELAERMRPFLDRS